ncbi:hypothetical protein K457DRAFT_14236 [Linnemannia elongata AG-77]|uniref:Uncharacterized protein n=1 Tax=Linnemannia elongata AG-77 TaxID=1314771 RepID=A0A197K9M1_9FUNG|nr:hypothetical protein K457DRAFT_14236 [Linnemannia elongata AG-77]
MIVTPIFPAILLPSTTPTSAVSVPISLVDINLKIFAKASVKAMAAIIPRLLEFRALNDKPRVEDSVEVTKEATNL